MVALEQVFSDVESSHAGSSVSSCASSASMAGSMKNIKLPVRPFDRSVPQPEDSRREFYAKCLSVKFSFPPDHPAQSAKVAKLYKKAQKNNIPTAEYQYFIEFELNKCESKSKKTSRHSQPSSRSSK